MALLIKKYENRRLYNTEEKKYISLEDLRKLILDGAEVRVIEQKTERDITSQVLFQLILETDSEKLSSFPSVFLNFLIKSPPELISDYFGSFFTTQMNLYLKNRGQYMDMLSTMSNKMFGSSFNPFSPENLFKNPFFSSPVKESKPDHNDTPPPKENKDDTPSDTASGSEDEIGELQDMLKMLSKRLEKLEKKKK